MINKNSNTLLYKQIKQSILGEIDKIGPGGRLPSRPSLVKKYSVSRSTIDQAISELIGEDYLYSLDGSGTYVSERPAKVDAEQSGNLPVRLFGVIMPNISSQIYPEILRGIEDLSHEHNMNTVICNTYLDPIKQNDYIKKLINSHVSGLIIFPPIDPAEQSVGYSLLLEHKIPFVFCGRGYDTVRAPKVIIDNYKAGYMATKHLIDSGCKKIAFVCPILYQTVEERMNGYFSALSEAGMEIDNSLIISNPGEDHYKGGHEAINHLLDHHSSVDGVVAFSDEIGYAVMHAVRNRDLKIPDDIRIIGNGDYEISNSFDLKLSTVLYPKYEMGKTAATLLLNMIERRDSIPDYHRIVLPPELIVRDT